MLVKGDGSFTNLEGWWRLETVRWQWRSVYGDLGAWPRKPSQSCWHGKKLHFYILKESNKCQKQILILNFIDVSMYLTGKAMTYQLLCAGLLYKPLRVHGQGIHTQRHKNTPFHTHTLTRRLRLTHTERAIFSPKYTHIHHEWFLMQWPWQKSIRRLHWTAHHSSAYDGITSFFCASRHKANLSPTHIQFVLLVLSYTHVCTHNHPRSTTQARCSMHVSFSLSLFFPFFLFLTRTHTWYTHRKRVTDTGELVAGWQQQGLIDGMLLVWERGDMHTHT